MNASLPRRLGAMLYDGLLVLAVLFLATLPFVAALDGEPVPAGTLSYRVAMLGVVYAFFVLFWTRYGRTLGMQTWGLRIETADGTRPDLAAASLRFAAALLSWLPAGLGFLWQLVDREGLSWHDRLSGTRIRFYPRDKA